MDADAAELVDTVARERFPAGLIDATFVRAGLDEDGEQVLLVTVVYDPSKGELDRSRTVGLTRHLRHSLDAAGVIGFPVVSFVAKAEFADRQSAAA